MTKQQIINELYISTNTDNILSKLTSNNQLKEDLKQEVFLILMEMDGRKIKKAYNNNYLYYLLITIIKNQFHSNTSPFYKKYRLKYSELDDALIYDEDNNEDEIEQIRCDIDDFLNTLDFVDRELFKMYYKLQEYNKDNGKLRDKNCSRDKYSYQKIEDKLQVGNLKMSKQTIMYSIRNSKKKLEEWIKNNK